MNEPSDYEELSTEELAARRKVKPETIRSRVCREGHYFGLRPIKLPNRFLLWRVPREDISQDSDSR